MRYLEQRKARIEIVPMIDIMFFLLVFFVMVVLRMIPSSGLATQLPHSSTAQQIPHPKVLVAVADDGGISVENQAISLSDLTARLAAGNAAETAVTIASSKSVTVQQLMAVMDACRTAGVTQLGLAAQIETQP
ncbi:ExbD/TolR family protein [Telmatospirillum siberiense]|uniref:Biopolymer transporter ExbD n=1 Tax=Telmatospirillum siberiense TaxID=382514 RepID=A0A2N3Q0P7_9PROT|nr:biopolymer transporter ExbD [Telmatospirillum siberiense]PKU26223.1 biopolymer transporter ExbD [Telmatospirillum siberiense]